jgi:hypothetical protein
MPRILLFFLRHGPVTVAVFLTPNAKPRSLTELCIMIDSVHDSVRAKNDLANIFFLYSGTMRPNPGIHVVSYSGRPDQFVSHEAIIGALPDDCSLEEIAEHVFGHATPRACLAPSYQFGFQPAQRFRLTFRAPEGHADFVGRCEGGD